MDEFARNAIIAIVVASFSFITYNMFIDERTVCKGDVYLWSFDYNDNNPFEKPTIDTITILGVKSGYVLYRYNNGLTISTKQRFMNNTDCVIRKISPK